MPLKTSRPWLGFSAALATAALIASGTGEISARTQYFGADRMTIHELPVPDGEMCAMPEHPAYAIADAALQADASPEWEWAQAQFRGGQTLSPPSGVLQPLGGMCQ